MVLKEDDIKKDAVINIAKKMMLAARTAPKGRGINNLALIIVTDETIKTISVKMEEISLRTGSAFFSRDAQNILHADAILLLGTVIKPVEMNDCGLCGMSNCDNKRKYKDVPCAFNVSDLGIAIGSAVSIAADNRTDCRVMFTIGKAVKELGIMGNDVKIIYGIPLSATSKSPFFDRK